MKSINEFIIAEGKYGPTGKEAAQKMQSAEWKKYQEIIDKFNERGKKELKKYFDEDGYDKLYLMLPQVSDGFSRRLCRHLEYNDILVSIPNTIYYYVINRDILFGFEVDYGGFGPSTYVSGEHMFTKTDIFGTKSAKFFAELFKELNPNTKLTIEKLEAE